MGLGRSHICPRLWRWRESELEPVDGRGSGCWPGHTARARGYGLLHEGVDPPSAHQPVPSTQSGSETRGLTCASLTPSL